MDKAGLVARFKSELEDFQRHESFVAKAKSYADRFNPAVVQKVIADNRERMDDSATRLVEFAMEADALIAQLDADRAGVLRGGEDSRLAMEELDLRLAIGEIGEDEYLTPAADHRGALDSIDSRVAAIDADLADLRGVAAAWTALAEQHGYAGPAADEPEEALESSPAGFTAEAEAFEEEEEEPAEDALAGEDDSGDLDIDGFDAEDEGRGVHVQDGTDREDVSAVFERAQPAQPAEVAEPIDAPEDASEEAPLFEAGDLADVGGDRLTFGAPSGAPASGLERHAALVYQEGTADEVVHAIHAGTLTIGRARDNDVQVKNDSKVSRNHSRIFRRDDGYYIEDNKSANGTLVDGELITERRLFGGEEVIVGETFFRFRILD